MHLARLIVLLALASNCTAPTADEGSPCSFAAQPVTSDFVDPLTGDTGEMIKTSAVGTWRGLVNWLGEVEGLTVNRSASSSPLELLISNPGSTAYVVGMHSGSDSLGCDSYLEVPVDVVLSSADGALKEHRRVSLRSFVGAASPRLELDMLDPAPGGSLRVAANPDGVSKLLGVLAFIYLGIQPSGTVGARLESATERSRAVRSVRIGEIVNLSRE